jgi:hypothetical protein
VVFCQKCGVKNEDDAVYCKGCGGQLLPTAPAHTDDWEPRMRMRRHHFSGWSIFWGLIVIVFGLWVFFEFGLKHVHGLPQWVYDAEFCWILPIIIGALIILAGLRMLINWD